jgi:hypothetical protein
MHLSSSWPGIAVRRTASLTLAYARPSTFTSVVIAGLDPAIHRLRTTLAKKMDTRVKPAYDEIPVDGRGKPGHDEIL